MDTIPVLKTFLTGEADQLISRLDAAAKPLWGRMDAQQMLEHLRLTMLVSYGRIKPTLSYDPERAEKMKRIGLLSDRPIQREFKNPLLPGEPIPYHTSSLDEAKQKLKQSTSDFISYYEASGPEQTNMHNVFGALNYHEWLWFHRKHFTHHFTQFGLIADEQAIR